MEDETVHVQELFPLKVSLWHLVEDAVQLIVLSV